jgi:hypothetical protein
LDQVTRLLCYACSLLSKLPIPVSGELKAWYESHLRDDALRLQQEQERKKQEETEKERQQRLSEIRERLMGQLTPEEMDAVGLWRKK